MQIIALGTDSKQPTILEFSRFLYHVNRVYEISRLATDPDYEFFQFPSKMLPQAFSRLRVEDRLLLDGVRHESPWSLKTSMALTATAIGAIWGIVQTYESISDRTLNVEKLQAEIRGQMLTNIEKARQQHIPLTDEEARIVRGSKTDGLTFKQEQWIREMAQRNALQYYQSSQDTLKKLPLRVSDLSVKITDDTKRPKKNR